MKEHGSWAGETNIQKAAYILTKVLGVPMDFEFTLYKHGPFSFELRNELSSLRASGFLAWEIRGLRYGPSLKAGELGEALKTQVADAPRKYENQLDLVARKLGDKDVKAFERFTTAVFVTLQGRTRPADRAVRIHKLKQHVTVPEAEAAVQEADAFLAEVNQAVPA